MRYNYYNLLNMDQYLKDKYMNDENIEYIKNAFNFLNDDFKDLIYVNGKTPNFTVDNNGIYNKNFHFGISYKGSKIEIPFIFLVQEGESKHLVYKEISFEKKTYYNYGEREYVFCTYFHQKYRDIEKFIDPKSTVKEMYNIMEQILLPDEEIGFHNDDANFYRIYKEHPSDVGGFRVSSNYYIKTPISFFVAVNEYESYFKDKIKILKKEQ